MLKIKIKKHFTIFKERMIVMENDGLWDLESPNDDGTFNPSETGLELMRLARLHV